MEKKDSVAIVASKAAGEEAPVPAWSPYEEPPKYVPPENPFDPNIVDDEEEVTRVWSPSSYPIRIVFC